MSKEKKTLSLYESEVRMAVFKIVGLLAMGALSFIGSSFASKSYVDDVIETRIQTVTSEVNLLKTQIGQMHTTIRGMKKDTCYTRAAIAKLIKEPAPNCLESTSD